MHTKEHAGKPKCINLQFQIKTLSHSSITESYSNTHSSNMAKKLVMKVPMNCQKCRTKALQVAAAASGVNFVGLDGEGKDKVVVIGDGVDAVRLTKCMRKKFGYADIVSLEDK